MYRCLDDSNRRLSSPIAAGVTLIAVSAVVDIPRHVGVLEVVGIISSMTTGTLEDGIVV